MKICTCSDMNIHRYGKKIIQEDETTDNLKDKQSREKEQLKIKHDTEMDADRRRLTRLKNRSTNPTYTNEVSDAVWLQKKKFTKI